MSMEEVDGPVARKRALTEEEVTQGPSLTTQVKEVDALRLHTDLTLSIKYLTPSSGPPTWPES
jgi:hypothetical protein